MKNIFLKIFTLSLIAALTLSNSAIANEISGCDKGLQKVYNKFKIDNNIWAYNAIKCTIDYFINSEPLEKCEKVLDTMTRYFQKSELEAVISISESYVKCLASEINAQKK